VFQRAAGDRRGGWLFGISYGFLLWMLGPITFLQILLGRPLATGGAAMGILVANLLAGLVLGLIFPWVHQWVRGFMERRISGSPQGLVGAAESTPGTASPRTAPHIR
jgi:hypothetical protein